MFPLSRIHRLSPRSTCLLFLNEDDDDENGAPPETEAKENTQDTGSDSKTRNPRLEELLQRGQQIVMDDERDRRAGTDSKEIADLNHVIVSLWKLTKHEIPVTEQLAKYKRLVMSARGPFSYAHLKTIQEARHIMKI